MKEMGDLYSSNEKYMNEISFNGRLVGAESRLNFMLRRSDRCGEQVDGRKGKNIQICLPIR